MGIEALPSQVVRFGVFEVHLRAGELRKHGLKVKLQEQPFQILAMLLERPGEVVTREDIQEKLWSKDTFVDFDNALNAAISKLREALGDSADNPRFVGTLPRRGYRFIYPVAPVSPPATDVGAGLVPAQGPPQGALLRRRWVVAVVSGVVLILLPFAAYLLMRPLPPPTVTRVTQLTNDGLTKNDIMVTDGPRIYFSEVIGGHWTPAVVSAASGDPRAIPMPFQDASVLDISRDDSELLVNDREGALWSLAVLGGSPRRIGDITSSKATWSPDGQEIAYLREDAFDLFVAKSDGTASRKLVTARGFPQFIRWSPDGSRISLSLYDGKANSLWEVAADGSNLHPVLPTWNFTDASCAGHWTPDGRYLLFDSFRGGPDSIWAIREKGGLFERLNHDPVRLTTGPMEMGKPVPSRDGKRVFVLGTLPRGELLRYDPKPRQFVPYLRGISPFTLEFSRDGQWMVYVTYPERTLWKCRADGSQRLQLTFPPIQAYLPRWSPDGRRIVFADVASTPRNIFLISAEGGNPEPLPLDPGRFGGNPGWSPDGKKLVYYQFASSPPSPSSPESVSIRLYDMETKQISKVAGSDGFFAPRWSPDGRYIAAISLDEQNLMLFDSRAQKWTAIASGGIGEPIWARESNYIYFDGGSPTSWSVYRVRVADRKVEILMSPKDMDAPAAFQFVGLALDDSVLMRKNVVSSEIYALDVDFP